MDNELLKTSEEIEVKKIPTRLNVFLILCVIIAALASMGDLTLSIKEAASISALVLFIYVVSRMIFHNVYTENVLIAKEGEEYRSVSEEYRKISSEIYDRGLFPKLPELCLRYREEELRAFRSEILSDVNISYEVYEKSYRGKSRAELKRLGLSRSARYAIARANAAKGIYVAQDTLLSGDCKPRKRGDLLRRSSERQQRNDYIWNGASGLLTTVLAGVIVISVVFNFSLHTVIQWAIRMTPIATAALTAAPAGRRNVTSVAIPYIKNKTSVLKTFIAWETEPEQTDEHGENEEKTAAE
ncbi:MAG: hypothetical protein IKA64_01925 [Clostridia bacterium]|nr:hypothetical protein [Clostridia bacterium]